jgi:hypothetical protein
MKNKAEYQNFMYENNKKKSPSLKVSTLLRNYSENILYKEKKANKSSASRIPHPAAYPQTSRYAQCQVPSMLDSIQLNSPNSFLSPQKQASEDASNCCNIFKQRRNTQSGPNADGANANRGSNVYKQMAHHS